ncbi:YdeI/OmpD-associated family protein [Roseivirga sp. UBA1976]|uniref:YdeI/OmpD-associated family protein n=1 Tax=Roseivirga sp. UBA1976 TaxID=1947386 RepID=UPI00257D39FF|nr:YdeI/OmpD-associated family protein [Roseivirga sp. UBA1976]MEC7752433.1 YdeI/OmpD-associated family protein [Bacteroidota bacterium]|tara:strand:- start:21 stop:644 length:624 start_codon:yes stop_codon:yes gene_type:complete
MTTNVDQYLAEGCGRCSLGGTPDCKVHQWSQELQKLRSIALECGLTEESKWGVPCYTYHGANVAMISAFKDYCSLSFFKGALLKDKYQMLEKPGPNSQAARLFKFTNLEQILQAEDSIRLYLFEAIEVEKKGLKVDMQAKNQLDYPDELQAKFKDMPELKTAFEALTPGRQRGYIIHFSQPKQSKTRLARIEKLIPKIMDGKGFFDR